MAKIWAWYNLISLMTSGVLTLEVSLRYLGRQMIVIEIYISVRCSQYHANSSYEHPIFYDKNTIIFLYFLLYFYFFHYIFAITKSMESILQDGIWIEYSKLFYTYFKRMKWLSELKFITKNKSISEFCLLTRFRNLIPSINFGNLNQLNFQ